MLLLISDSVTRPAMTYVDCSSTGIIDTDYSQSTITPNDLWNRYASEGITRE